MNTTNKYVVANRYGMLPLNECLGIREALRALIATSKDPGYIKDGLLRIEALNCRISNLV